MAKQKKVKKEKFFTRLTSSFKKHRARAYSFLIIALLALGVISYALIQGLTASAEVCRQSSQGQLHLTNTKLLFKNSSDVAFCVAGAKGDLVMTIRHSGNGQVWAKKIQSNKLVKSPGYLKVKPDAQFQTGAYTFALVDRGTDNRIDVSFGVTGSEPKHDPYYGVNTHYIKAKVSGPEGRADLNNTYPLLDQIGVSTVRETIAWNNVEKTKGQLAIPGTYVDDFMSRAQKSNDGVIFVAAYGNAFYTGSNSAPPVTNDQVKKYAAYIDFVLKKYPQIRQVEIYNEYDHVADKTKNSGNNGTGREYAELFKKTVASLRNDFKQTKVKLIAGNISTLAGSGRGDCQCEDVQRFERWWSEFGAGGGFKVADALSFHRYDNRMPSDDDAYHKRLDRIVKQYNKESLPIIVSEVGLTTANRDQWRGVIVNQRDQAAGLIQTYVGYMRGKIVSNVLWYDAIDDGMDPTSVEHNWGLFKRPTSQAPYAYEPKWSALAFFWMRRELDEGYRLTDVKQPIAGVQQYIFSKGDSKRHVLWREMQFASNDPTSVDVTVNIRGDAPTSVYNMLGEKMAERNKKYPSGKITIPVWTTPMYINN